MQIKPSASIRQNYNEIAALCKSTGVLIVDRNMGGSKMSNFKKLLINFTN
jgi:hypothetical protein